MEMPMTRVNQQHFHVSFGPEQISTHGQIPIESFAGPYSDVIIDDPGEAVTFWVNTVKTHVSDELFADEDVEEAVDYVVNYYDDEDEYVAFAFDGGGFQIWIYECWGCVAAHMN